MLPAGLAITSVSEADRCCEDQIWHGLGMLQNGCSVQHKVQTVCRNLLASVSQQPGWPQLVWRHADSAQRAAVAQHLLKHLLQSVIYTRANALSCIRALSRNVHLSRPITTKV